MSNVTYHPVPVMRWEPVEGGSDFAMVSRLLEQWMQDGRRRVIGHWSLSLWQYGRFRWITVNDMTCAPPNHEPRSFDLVPSMDWTKRRKPHLYEGSLYYVEQMAKHLEEDTWYLNEWGTEPDVWLVEVRWIEELGVWLAAAIEYGNGLIRGWAVSRTDGDRAALAMAAIDDAIGDRCLPEVIVVPNQGTDLDVRVRNLVHERLAEDTAVISLADFDAPGTVATVNMGIRMLANCGREFLLAKGVEG